MIEIKDNVDDLHTSPTALAQNDEEAAAYTALAEARKEPLVGYLNETASTSESPLDINNSSDYDNGGRYPEYGEADSEKS